MDPYISVIQTFIESELESYIKTELNIKVPVHNHPPVRFLVDDCEYCNLHGNIFVIGK